MLHIRRIGFGPRLFAMLVALAVAFPTDSTAATFTDATSSAGLAFVGRSAGAAWGDYDEDGCIDLFVSGDNKLYNNDCDGTFTTVTGVGLTGLPSLSTGVVWVDYDNDGDLDLSVVSKRDPNALYSNDGDGTFTDVSVASGFDDERGSTNATWGDYDNDGDLDVFVANRWDSIAPGMDVTDRLYRNDGDGTFTDMAPTLGIDGGDSRLTFMGAWIDYDNDNDLDLYVAIDFVNDVLYRNNGDGTFTDVSGDAGITGPQHTMGTSVGDPNNDGCLDIIGTNNTQGNNGPTVLYFNDCEGGFVNTGMPDRGPLGTVDWGVNFIDFDNDGDEDLSIVSGGMLTPAGEPNVLYENDGSGNFSDVTTASGTADGASAFGSAWADFDGDGDLDWFVVNDTIDSVPDPVAAANVLFRNDGPTGNYLRVRLHGVESNSFGVGARVEATVGSSTQVRIVQAGRSYQSGEELSARFGFGTETSVDEVTVTWPSGVVDTIFGVAVNGTLEVTEGQGQIFADGFESGDTAAWSSSVP